MRAWHVLQLPRGLGSVNREDLALISQLAQEHFGQEIEIAAMKRQWWGIREQHCQSDGPAELRLKANLIDLSCEIEERERRFLTLTDICDKFEVGRGYCTTELIRFRR